MGCFGPTSEQIISRCKIEFDHGIESVQIALPHWHPLSDNELGNFFDNVCGTFPEKPIILYNSPRSKRPLVQKGYIDGAIDKAYARIRGLEIDLTMRSPYMPLNEADFAWLENAISQSVFVNSK